MDSSFYTQQISSIIKLQACIRGWLVRKYVKEIHEEYRSIVLSIDGPSTTVTWSTSYPHHPDFGQASQSFPHKKLAAKEMLSHAIIEADETIQGLRPCLVTKNLACQTQTADDIVHTNNSQFQSLFQEEQKCEHSPKEQLMKPQTMFKDSEIQTSFIYTEESECVHKTDLLEGECVDNSTECLDDSIVINRQKIDAESQSENPVLKSSAPEQEVNPIVLNLAEKHVETAGDSLPSHLSELEELQRSTTMELLWVQQAIVSRKNYLKLKAKG